MKHKLILIATLLATILALFAACGKKADSNTDPETGLAYTVNKTEGFVTIEGRGNCTDAEIVIPNEVGGYPVRTIAAKAFLSDTKLTSIRISDNVTDIGEWAFSTCSNLTSVTIPNGVTKIGNYAFHRCGKLGSITIPKSVTNIGWSAFRFCEQLSNVFYTGDLTGWCGISFGDYDANPLYYAQNFYINDKLVTEAAIPNSVKSIGNYTFVNRSSLTSITVPSSVTSIGNRAFCMTSITYQGTKAQWNAINKDSAWNGDTSDYTVYCTDGNITVHPEEK